LWRDRWWEGSTSMRVREADDADDGVDASGIEGWFDSFIAVAEPKLRRALVAALGQDAGLEATSIALLYAWENRDRVRSMENPRGYLYRVGRTRVHRRRREPLFLAVPDQVAHEVEPKLPAALERLSEKQRAAVMMVHAEGWARDEAAAALDVSVSSLDTHLARGLTRLRAELGVVHDA
jgi:DNA-directed RNA polymerase specialized sigma24 family protein